MTDVSEQFSEKGNVVSDEWTWTCHRCGEQCWTHRREDHVESRDAHICQAPSDRAAAFAQYADRMSEALHHVAALAHAGDDGLVGACLIAEWFATDWDRHKEEAG